MEPRLKSQQACWPLSHPTQRL